LERPNGRYRYRLLARRSSTPLALGFQLTDSERSQKTSHDAIGASLARRLEPHEEYNPVMTTAQEVAEWMLAEVTRNGELYQDAAGHYIVEN
jgi:hypothetical protein